MLTFLMIAGVMFLVTHFVSAFAYEAFHGPSELIFYDKDKTYDGYTLFAHTHIFLIDMEGNVVNKWEIPEGYCIEKTARLLDNGNLLRAIRPPQGQKVRGTGVIGSVFQELDWDGNVLWEYKDPRKNYVAHHNFKRIFNKKLNAYTTIFITTRGTGDSIYISKEEAVSKGCDPGKSYDDARPDGVIEVDMEGNIVWEWWSFDHVVQALVDDGSGLKPIPVPECSLVWETSMSPLGSADDRAGRSARGEHGYSRGAAGEHHPLTSLRAGGVSLSG